MEMDVCSTCDDTGYVVNPEYRDDKGEVGLTCPDCSNEEEYGPYTSCGACGGNGCDRCMPQWFEEFHGC